MSNLSYSRNACNKLKTAIYRIFIIFNNLISTNDTIISTDKATILIHSLQCLVNGRDPLAHVDCMRD